MSNAFSCGWVISSIEKPGNRGHSTNVSISTRPIVTVLAVIFNPAVSVILSAHSHHHHHHLHQPLARVIASTSRRLIGEELRISGELIPDESCRLSRCWRFGEKGALRGAEEGLLRWDPLTHTLAVTLAFCDGMLEALYVYYSGCCDSLRTVRTAFRHILSGSAVRKMLSWWLWQVWHRFESWLAQIWLFCVSITARLRLDLFREKWYRSTIIFHLPLIKKFFTWYYFLIFALFLCFMPHLVLLMEKLVWKPLYLKKSLLSDSFS